VGAPGDPYATLAQMREWLRVETGDTRDDDVMTRNLASAAYRINEHCGRPVFGFNLEAAPSARTYVATSPDHLPVDDIGDPAITVTYGQNAGPYTPVGSEQWETCPYNAIANGRAIEELFHLWGMWPAHWPSIRVQVTARHGWPAVPQPVIDANLIEAAALYARRDSASGIIGANDAGSIRVSRMPLDPDAASLVSTFMRGGFG
jgi:hypothetical protein